MRPWIIAEISCNHTGSLDRALELVEAAAQAGADAVKVQTWSPGTMVLGKQHVLRDGPWAGWDLVKLYEEAHTPWEWHEAIWRRAHDLGIEAFGSAFDARAVQFLDSLGVKRFKISSFEITDLPLITYTAGFGKPLIISTGMATRSEIDDAIAAARGGGAKGGDITLLKCTSAYPAQARDANLATMNHMRQTWPDCPIGVSDHTAGIGVAIVAAGMGATVIEKHLMLSGTKTSLDKAFSIEPHDLATLCREAEGAAECWGEANYGPHDTEKPQLGLRRSLYFAADLPAGHVLEPGDLVTARPARGLQPRFMARLFGRPLARNVSQAEPVTGDAMEGYRVPAVT